MQNSTGNIQSMTDTRRSSLFQPVEWDAGLQSLIDNHPDRFRAGDQGIYFMGSVMRPAELSCFHGNNRSVGYILYYRSRLPALLERYQTLVALRGERLVAERAEIIRHFDFIPVWTHMLNMHLLVADDHRAALLHIRNALSNLFGFGTGPGEGRVHMVMNGTEAIAKLAETQYDLLITDIDMPGADGFEVIRFFQDAGADRSTRIIVFSGSPRSRYADSLMRYNVLYYVQKDDLLSELIEALWKVSVDAFLSTNYQESQTHLLTPLSQISPGRVTPGELARRIIDALGQYTDLEQRQQVLQSLGGHYDPVTDVLVMGELLRSNLLETEKLTIIQRLSGMLKTQQAAIAATENVLHSVLEEVPADPIQNAIIDLFLKHRIGLVTARLRALLFHYKLSTNVRRHLVFQLCRIYVESGRSDAPGDRNIRVALFDMFIECFRTDGAVDYTKNDNNGIREFILNNFIPALSIGTQRPHELQGIIHHLTQLQRETGLEERFREITNTLIPVLKLRYMNLRTISQLSNLEGEE